MTIIIDSREKDGELKAGCDQVMLLDDIEQPDDDGTPFSYDFCVVTTNEGSGKVGHHAQKIFRFERKAQPIDTPVLTPRSWAPIGKICVGDHVIGSDGYPTRVVGVYPQGRVPIYRVTFSDGSTTRCSYEHLWTVAKRGCKWKTKSLADLINHLRAKDGSLQWMIPITQPIQFPVENLPIEPYLMGVILGDGCVTDKGVTICSADEAILNYVSDILPKGHALSHEATITWRITGPTGYGPRNLVTAALRELGLIGHRAWEKFIPNIYLFASIEQRVALLQGIMDTDGWACRDRSSVKFASSSKRLACDVVQLAESLGCTTRMHVLTNRTYTYKGTKKTGRPSWVISIKYPLNLLPFRLKRKTDARKLHRVGSHKPRRFIKKIERIEDAEAVCIRVSNPDGLYVTERFIVTHNTWKDFVASWDSGRLERQLSYVDGLIIEFDAMDLLDGPSRKDSEEEGGLEHRIKHYYQHQQSAAKHLARLSANTWVIHSFNKQSTLDILRWIERNGYDLTVRPNKIKLLGSHVRYRILNALPHVNFHRKLPDGRFVGEIVEPLVDWKKLEEALNLPDWIKLDLAQGQQGRKNIGLGTIMRICNNLRNRPGIDPAPKMVDKP